MPYSVSSTQESQHTQLSMTDRLEVVRQQRASNKPSRRIARELGVDSKTVRRDREIIALPAEQYQAILAGAPAEPYLVAARKKRVLTEQRKRGLEEQARGSQSDFLAEALLAWLEEQPLAPVLALRVVRDIDYPLYNLGTSTRMPRRDVVHVIEEARPRPVPNGSGIDWTNYCLQWAYRWIPQVAPERAIRDAGITKVRQKLEKMVPGTLG
jgi:hypothetical protein